MTWDEFDPWSSRSIRGAAAQQVAAGLLPEHEATARAEQMFASLLPQGLATPLHVLRTVRRAEAPETVVGHLWMRVRPLSDEVEGYVFDVEIDPGLRGRGLGHATIQAAEQLARGLDASVVRLNVFGHNTAALRLYDSLRYAVTSTAMTSRLDRPRPADAGAVEPPMAGPPLRLRDLTVAEYDALRPRLQADQAAAIAVAGVLPAAEAARLSADELTRLLPRGPLTPGHRLWAAFDGDDRAGVAWIGVQERTDGRHAFAHRLWVPEAGRGLGLERSMLLGVEPWLRELGVVSLGLMVLGDDPRLTATYALDGFEVMAQTMAKALP
jgi:ribosomal protein S18 acetylase RimI-like enzyme